MLKFTPDMNIMLEYGIFESELQVSIILGTVWQEGKEWKSR